MSDGCQAAPIPLLGPSPRIREVLGAPEGPCPPAGLRLASPEASQLVDQAFAEAAVLDARLFAASQGPVNGEH